MIICKECVKQGLKSRVYVGISTQTAMMGSSYYDESGNFHYHNPNTTTTNYKCSNGHEFQIKTGGKA
jgi:hypothetical protein